MIFASWLRENQTKETNNRNHQEQKLTEEVKWLPTQTKEVVKKDISTSNNENRCVISVRIQSYSGPHFIAFKLNMESTEYLSVFSPNAGKCGAE